MTATLRRLLQNQTPKKKTLLLDHISDAYNLLSIKYGKGLHFVIPGATNDLKLDSILGLDQHIVQVVTKWTRMNPPAILDPIIMTLSKFYLEPMCLDPDPDQNGVKSDQRIPLVRPINTINNKAFRHIREIKVRRFAHSGICKLQEWFKNQTWEKMYNAESAHEKADFFSKNANEHTK